jgi:lysine 2,3-aminomutase
MMDADRLDAIPESLATTTDRAPWQGVADHDWLDWRWQLRNRLRSAEQLAQCFALTAAQRTFLQAGLGFEVGVTPFFASLAQPFHAADPIARQVVPEVAELTVRDFERADPLGEEPYRKAPGLVHKYPDRVLLLVTDTCASYCRYCTRARWVATGSETLGMAELDQAIAYIAATSQIRDVLVSGGDPLLLSTAKLSELLDRLALIPHLRFIRIGTRVPVFLPMRVDAALAAALKPRRIPVFVNVHCNHFRELAPPVVAALARLADAGVPLGGQAVLLRGVNDDAATLRETFYAMLSARVRPYYLFHCDPIRGSSHLRTSVSRGLEIMAELVGHVSGMAVPKYCIDLEGGGKVPLWPTYVERLDRDQVHLTNFRGEKWTYVNATDDTATDGAK